MVMSRMLKKTRTRMPIITMPTIIRNPPNAAAAIPIFRLFPVNLYINSESRSLL